MLSKEKLDAMRKLRKEFDALQNNPITSLGVTVGLPDPKNIFKWKISMLGPADTPYAGGVFILEANFPDTYPKDGPKIKFLTKIFHCNVFGWGICISTLNNWVPTPMDKVISDIFQLFYVFFVYSILQHVTFLSNYKILFLLIHDKLPLMSYNPNQKNIHHHY